MSLRSFLFAPGNHERRLERTLDSDADAIIADLEDAVATGEKAAARETVRGWIARPRGQRRGYVRINALGTPFAFDDVAAIVRAGLDGIVLPKAESARDLAIADYLIAAHERARGLEAGSIDLIPIVETAKGADALRELVRAIPRVKRLAFGSGDFSNDTGTTWSLDNPLTAFARAQLAIASRAAGIEPPVDSPWPRLDDEAGLIADAASGRALGFQGKLTIHPKQLDIVNKTFAPTAAEIAFARKVCDAFDAAESAGSSALVVDGAFVDYPVVYRARSVLATARKMGIVADR